MFAPSPALARVLALAILAAPAAAQTPLWRLNCGGGAVTTAGGVSFDADAAYDPQAPGLSAGHVGGVAVGELHPGPANGPLNDPSAAVHSSARSGFEAYRLDVPSGDVLVRLHFAEVDHDVQGPSLRVFDLLIEGKLVLAGLDVVGELGQIQYAGEVTLLRRVNDGVLDIESVPGQDPALLNAIEVWSPPPAPPALAIPAGFTVEAGYGRNVLVWDPAVAPTLAGYRIWRAPAPGGPWIEIATTWTAPARYHDDGAPIGVPSHYRIAARDPFGLQSAQSPTAAATARDSADSALRVYELEISPENRAIIDANIFSDPKLEVPAIFRYQGQTWQAEARYRGAGSRDAPKKSWKIKLPDVQPFEGRNDINLKAHFLDASLIHEPLAGVVFEDSGHPIYRQRRVHLVVNGVFRGVFSEVERVDEYYLLSRGREGNISAYRARSNLSVLASSEAYEEKYDKTTGPDGDYGDLIAFIQFLNDPATDAVDIAAVFDVDDYLGYLASLGIVGYSQQPVTNYHLIHDLDLDRWNLVTWDNDRGFADSTKVLASTGPGCLICGGSVLMDKILAHPPFYWRYLEKVAALSGGAADPARFLPEIAARHAEIELDARADVYKQGWELDGPFEAGVPALETYATERASFLAGLVPAWQDPQPPTQVWINELLAKNATGILDEAGELEDWIELTNAGPGAIDAGGLYLTDDLADPTRWQLPAGSLIPAGGHLLVWADKEPGDGPLHADLKLDADGEELALFDSDGVTLLDLIHFGPQEPDVAFGRRGDGGAHFGPLAPTPLAPNDPLANRPPRIEWLAQHPQLPSSSHPIEVACTIWDEGPTVTATLHWRTTGSFQTAPMTLLGWGRHAAILPPQAAGTLVEYYVEVSDGLGAATLAPFGAPAELETFAVVDPVPGDLRINEVLASNDTIAADETGAFEDYIELYNASAGAIQLDGMFLTDDLGNSDKWSFPPGTAIGPGQTLLVWADDDPGDGPLHATFKLDKAGEEVGIFDTLASGNALLDGLSYSPQTTDVALGSLPDGSTVRVLLYEPSPAQSNVPIPGSGAPFDTPTGHAAALALTGSAQVGQPMTVTVAGAPPSSAGLLLLSVDTLGLPLGPLGTLLVLPIEGAILPLSTDAQGAGALPVPLPPNPILGGLTLYGQALVGVELSGGIAVTVAP